MALQNNAFEITCLFTQCMNKCQEKILQIHATKAVASFNEDNMVNRPPRL